MLWIIALILVIVIFIVYREERNKKEQEEIDRMMKEIQMQQKLDERRQPEPPHYPQDETKIEGFLPDYFVPCCKGRAEKHRGADGLILNPFAAPYSVEPCEDKLYFTSTPDHVPLTG